MCLPATPCEPEASPELDAPPNPVAQIDLAQLAKRDLAGKLSPAEGLTTVSSSTRGPSAGPDVPRSQREAPTVRTRPGLSCQSFCVPQLRRARGGMHLQCAMRVGSSGRLDNFHHRSGQCTFSPGHFRRTWQRRRRGNLRWAGASIRRRIFRGLDRGWSRHKHHDDM
jgi:hypothetical protein